MLKEEGKNSRRLGASLGDAITLVSVSVGLRFQRLFCHLLCRTPFDGRLLRWSGRLLWVSALDVLENVRCCCHGMS